MTLMRQILLCLFLVFSTIAAASDSVQVLRDNADGTIGHGSAALVHIEGRELLITAAHVVHDKDGPRPLFVRMPAKVVSIDVATDLALIEISPPAVLPIGDVEPGEGTAVNMPGFPAGRPRVLEGAIAKPRTWSVIRNKANTSHFDRGASGSPVIADGKLIGVVVAGENDGRGNPRSDTALYVPLKLILEFIGRKDSGGIGK